MPYYPLPLPAHVIEEVDDERRWGEDEEMERRAENRAKIQDLWAPINAIYDSGTPLFTKAAILQQEKAKWDAGGACRELVATLQGVADAGRLQRVGKVVAFACHRPSIVDGAERVAAEHALVLSIRDFFARQDPTTTVRCYAQDPVYQDVDREVLEELGMTVLDNPRGFLEVDESAAVFSLAPDVAVRQIVADIAKPALMIWSKIRQIPREGYWVGRAEQ